MTSVPISALEHHVYCPRQCALIHVERTFDENVYTLRGARLHERVESGLESIEGDRRVVRSLPLVSVHWGIHGKADVVEFRPEGPFPVEYKAGRRPGLPAQVQLCAQALCLEEMYVTPVVVGAVYCGASRRRFTIDLGSELRRRTAREIELVRELLDRGVVPDAPNDRRCPPCSLYSTCMPGVVAQRRRLAALNTSLYRPLVEGSRHA